MNVFHFPPNWNNALVAGPAMIFWVAVHWVSDFVTPVSIFMYRDDIGGFLPDYLDEKILPVDPFQQIDQSGVGQLVQMGVKLGRQTRPGLKCGICGEHGGDPSSVKFCVKAGLNYVSCSPYRVPIARLAAAQAAIEG